MVFKVVLDHNTKLHSVIELSPHQFLNLHKYVLQEENGQNRLFWKAADAERVADELNAAELDKKMAELVRLQEKVKSLGK